MSGTSASQGQVNDDPVGYKTTWGQKHWTDSTKKKTGNSHEDGPKDLKMYLERLISGADETVN